MTNATRPVGDLIREWRQRRRLSQFDLACDADISTKHLSFLETGRAAPSQDMLLHLADRLAIPLRDRNVMLSAAGFGPSYQERGMTDPDFRPARACIDQVLRLHEPNPALAIDRHWMMLAANAPITRLMRGIDPILLKPPVNIVRIALHPAGLAPRIINLVEWRRHMIGRISQQIEINGDPTLLDLLEEVRDYPLPPGPAGRERPRDHEIVAVPFRLATVHGAVSFLNTTTVFATPLDITLSELMIESFFPADQATANLMRLLTESPQAENGKPDNEAPGRFKSPDPVARPAVTG